MTLFFTKNLYFTTTNFFISYFLVTSYFIRTFLNTTSPNIGGTDAWAVPFLKFLGDSPPKSLPMTAGGLLLPAFHPCYVPEPSHPSFLILMVNVISCPSSFLVTFRILSLLDLSSILQRQVISATSILVSHSPAFGPIHYRRDVPYIFNLVAVLPPCLVHRTTHCQGWANSTF